MKATLNKHLHERALGIISLIETCDQRIEIQNNFIERPALFGTTAQAEERKASLENAKKRLVEAYNKTLTKINRAKP